MGKFQNLYWSFSENISENPMWTLLISCLIHSFLIWYIKIRESLPFLYINLKWRAKFQIYRLLIRDSDWLNFIHFSGYKFKIRLVSRLRKREDQALISISTILKFPALFVSEFCLYLRSTYDELVCTGYSMRPDCWGIVPEKCQKLKKKLLIIKHSVIKPKIQSSNPNFQSSN